MEKYLINPNQRIATISKDIYGAVLGVQQQRHVQYAGFQRAPLLKSPDGM